MNEPKPSPSSGCGRGCSWLLAGFALLAAALYAFNVLTENDERISLRGEVVLSPSTARQTVGAACDRDGQEVIIAPSGEGATRAHLTNGVRGNDGSCNFIIREDVPVAESYRFVFSGFEDKQLRRVMIDTVGPSGETELQVRLNW